MRKIKKWEVMLAAENGAKINYTSFVTYWSLNRTKNTNNFINVTDCVSWAWDKGTYIIGNKTKDGYYLHEIINAVKNPSDIYKTITIFTDWDNFISYHIYRPKEIENITVNRPVIASATDFPSYYMNDYKENIVKRENNLYKFKHYSMWDRIVIILRSKHTELLNGDSFDIESLKKVSILDFQVKNDCYLCEEHRKVDTISRTECNKCELVTIMKGNYVSCDVFFKLKKLLQGPPIGSKVIRTFKEVLNITSFAEQIRDCVL